MNSQKIGSKLFQLNVAIHDSETDLYKDGHTLQLFLDPSMTKSEKLAAFIRFYCIENTDDEYVRLGELKEVKNGLDL